MTACFNCTLLNYYSWSVEERKFLMLCTDHAILNSAFMDNVLIFVASPLVDL